MIRKNVLKSGLLKKSVLKKSVIKNTGLSKKSVNQNITKSNPTKIRLREKTISVLDLGFEDAKRLRTLAQKKQHSKKRFFGVEWVKQKNLQTRTHNLKLTYGDALSKLKRLPSSSVNIVNADLFFSEYKVSGKLNGKIVARGVVTKHQKHQEQLLGQVFRVLKKNGRFFVIDYQPNLKETISLLEKNGFNCTSRVVPKSKMNKTTFLSMISDKLIVDARNTNYWQPHIITARKKKLVSN